MRRASFVKRRRAIAAAGAAWSIASVALAQAPRVVVPLQYSPGAPIFIDARVFDPKAFRPAATATRVPVTMIDRIPHVTAAIVFGETDEAEGTFRIDTGSWATMMLNRPFAEAHRFSSPGTPTRAVGASALG